MAILPLCRDLLLERCNHAIGALEWSSPLRITALTNVNITVVLAADTSARVITTDCREGRSLAASGLRSGNLATGSYF